MDPGLAKVLDVPVAYLYCDSDEVSKVLLAFNKAPKQLRLQALTLLSDATKG